MRPLWSPSVEVLHPWLVAQTAPKPWDPLEMTSVFADLATFAAYAVIPLLKRFDVDGYVGKLRHSVRRMRQDSHYLQDLKNVSTAGPKVDSIARQN